MKPFSRDRGIRGALRELEKARGLVGWATNQEVGEIIKAAEVRVWRRIEKLEMAAYKRGINDALKMGMQ